MDFLTSLATGVLSTATVIAIGGFVLKASFESILDRKMELFKQQLDINKSLHHLTLKSQIEFRERQLGEYYGPICAILKRGARLYKVHREGRLPDGIRPIINSILIEGNNMIVSILLQKSHLISGNKLPDSHVHFLTHAAIWPAFQNAKPQLAPPPESEFPEAYYPMAFEVDSVRTTEKLKKELAELHNRFGISAASES
jgi:hypothetical protein